jgi:uncharacterized protein
MADPRYLELQTILEASPVGEVLPALKALDLPDAWLTAGAIRNTVWNHRLKSNLPLNDLDIVFWSATARHSDELAAEAKLKQQHPTQAFQVRNQYKYGRWRHYNRTPLTSVENGLQRFLHTASAVGVRLGPSGAWQWLAPYGIDDLYNGVLRQTPALDVAEKEKAEQRAAALQASCPALQVLE